MLKDIAATQVMVLPFNLKIITSVKPTIFMIIFIWVRIIVTANLTVSFKMLILKDKISISVKLMNLIKWVKMHNSVRLMHLLIKLMNLIKWVRSVKLRILTKTVISAKKINLIKWFKMVISANKFKILIKWVHQNKVISSIPFLLILLCSMRWILEIRKIFSIKKKQ